MNTGVMRSMLLLDVPNISTLRIGVESYSKVFLSVAFVSALGWELATEMKFMGVVKNLVLALVFMGFFYQFHTKAVEVSFKASEELLREVSPRNIFLKKWNEVKVKNLDNSSGSFIDKIVVPNLNDLLGTALFLLSKVCILILKLIYTTVYYFTFIFAPVTAVLSFIPTSKGSMAGTITSSLWCILLPFVLAVFLALVGNTVQFPSENGQLAVSSMDHLIWIFGITLLMLLTPSFTYSLIKGSVASTADAVGVKMTGVGAKALVSLPILYGMGQKIFGKGKKGGKNNSNSLKNTYPYYQKQYSGQRLKSNRDNSTFQNSMRENAGVNFKQTDHSKVKLSEVKSNHTNSKQNSPVPSVSSSQKNASENKNAATTKIPSGSFNFTKDQTPNVSGQTRPSGMNQTAQRTDRPLRINPNATLHPRSVQTLARSANLVRPIQTVKRPEVRSSIERAPSKDFKTVRPKERQREV